MTRSTFRVVVWLVSSLVSSSLAAQSYLIRNYTVADGLPSPEVRGIAQDNRGRLWFATRGGLVAFDGSSWETVTLPGSSARPSLRAVCSTPSGVLWAVTTESQFRVFRGGAGGWMALPDAAPAPELDLGVSGLAATSAGGLELVAVGALRGGLFLWDGARWRRLGQEEGLPGASVLAVVGHGGVFYIATERSLCTLEGGKIGAALGALLPAGEAPLALGFGRESEPSSGQPLDLWVLTTRGLRRLVSGELQRVGPELKVAYGASGPPVLCPDPPRAAYLGNLYKLVRLDLASGEVEELGPAAGLASEGANSILVDREGSMWAASQRGVSQLVSRRFARFDEAHGLLQDEVTALCEVRPGVIVLGHNRGLSVLESGSVRHVPLAASHGFTDVPRVMDLLKGRDGEVWVAAATYGLFSLDRGGRLHRASKEERGKRHIAAVAQDSRGELWAAGDGLFRLAGGRLVPEELGGTAPGMIRRLLVGRDGSLLLATSRRGLLVRTDRQVAAIPGPETPGAESLYTIFEDSRGQLWAGSAAGLLKLDGTHLRFPAEAGLHLAEPVYLILEDRQGRLWFGTGDGVVRWDGSKARRFGVTEGFGGRETNRAAGLVDGQGRVWIGHDQGVSVYDGTRDEPPAAPPAVELLGLSSEGRLAPLDQPARLPHTGQAIEIRFRAASFIEAGGARYRHRLEGLEAEWTPEYRAGERAAHYAGLQPGCYRFHVQARGLDGPWSAPVVSAEIVVLPPYWRQWWFLALAAAGVLLVAFAFGRAILNRRYTRSLAREVALRTAELEQARAELEQERDFARSVMDSIGQGLTVTCEDGRFVYVNEAYSRIVGRPMAELLGKRPRDFTHSDDHPALETAGEARRRGEATNHVSHLQRPDGSLVPVLVSGVPHATRGSFAGTIAVITDISERRQAEQELRDSEERFRSFVEHSPLGIYRTTLDGRILLGNLALQRMLGYESLAELEAENVEEWSARGQFDRPSFLAAIERDGQVVGRETVWTLRDGRSLHVRENARTVRDESGRIAYLEGSIEDLTEQRALEGRLREAERLETVGQLAGGIAHDFNNILQAVLGHVQLLRLQGWEAGRAALAGAEIESLVQRGAGLTRQLLLFSRRGLRRPERLDLGELVRRSAGDLVRQLPEGVRLELELDPRPIVLEADSAQLEQALTNLAANAGEAMVGGGVVTLGTGRSGHQAFFEVSDTGPGISEEMRQRIFEPFFSTKDPSLGAGLGLSVVHGIASAHGGRVEVESEPGVGSRFRVLLPAPEAGGEAPAPAVKPAEQVANGGLRVLIVEDEPGARESLQQLLELTGYRVTAAACASEALAVPLAPAPDLLLTDFALPDMIGTELAALLKARWPELPVILMSGYTVDEAARRSVSAGNLRFLQKPFDFDTLMREIQAATRT
ncbi:MAG: PAS domain S-box protein [Acidobacteriota bacterium]